MNAGDNAQRLLQIALDLATVVHDESRDAIHATVAGIEPEDRDALLVVLAALVDVDRPVADLLAWVTWDEHGAPITSAHRNTVDVPARVRRHHAAYARGERAPIIVEDERTYQRQRKRAQRAVDVSGRTGIPTRALGVRSKTA